MSIAKLNAEVQALEKSLRLTKGTQEDVLSRTKLALMDSPEAQEAYTALSETQAHARMHDATLKIAQAAHQGAILSALAFYQELDNASVWKRNVSAEANKEEFLKANLEHLSQRAEPKGHAEGFDLAAFRLFVKDMAESMMPFLKMRERSDFIGLTELKRQYGKLGSKK